MNRKDDEIAQDLVPALRLLNARKDSGQPWAAAAMISQMLRDVDGVNVHWRTLEALFKRHPRLVAQRKSVGQLQFSIMAEGRARLGESAVLLVDPAAAVQATVTLHKLLSDVKGEVRICDPYFDVATVEHLDAVPGGRSIRILTENVKDSGTLRRVFGALNQGRPTQVRIGSGLHDRYLIDDESLLLLGGSLNGFGKRQTFVTKGGPDLRVAALQAFEARWQRGSPWP